MPPLEGSLTLDRPRVFFYSKSFSAHKCLERPSRATAAQRWMSAARWGSLIGIEGLFSAIRRAPRITV